MRNYIPYTYLIRRTKLWSWIFTKNKNNLWTYLLHQIL